jgi:hypothetical protein
VVSGDNARRSMAEAKGYVYTHRRKIQEKRLLRDYYQVVI